MRILAVDDDEMALEMLSLTLNEAGYEVIIAPGANEALRILQEEPVRMVITDWEMPSMSGLDLCRTLRTQELDRYVYVIMLTSHRGSEEIVDGLKAGADDFISKPFNPEELTVRVRAGERILGLEQRDVVLFSMAKLAESRDPETGRHLERVRNYCAEIARWCVRNQLPGYTVDMSFVRLIFETSPLHDIGKIGIPDSVLLKPGRLSDREFEIMKQHAALGAETLDAALQQFPSAHFLRMARDIAATHHERFDGSGYPAGLVGDNIPLCGRIVALADVYDALTSKRVYKSAFSHDVARSIIEEEAGSHFDPTLVRALQECEEQFMRTRESLAETAAVAV